jgi:hypothetical protein
LGEYGSPESRDRYDDLIAEWLVTNGDTVRYTLTVDDLCILYMEHADGYYRIDGKPTTEVGSIRQALRSLIQSCGATRAREFGPLKLKGVRSKMIDAGHVRTSVNRRIERIRQMFKWAIDRVVNHFCRVGGTAVCPQNAFATKHKQRDIVPRAAPRGRMGIVGVSGMAFSWMPFYMSWLLLANE